MGEAMPRAQAETTRCICEIDLILLESARATSPSSPGAVRRIDASDLAAAVG